MGNPNPDPVETVGSDWESQIGGSENLRRVFEKVFIDAKLCVSFVLLYVNYMQRRLKS